MNLSLEIKVIERFFVKDKKDRRYIQFVSSNKNRNKLLKDLSHFRYFNWELLEEVHCNEREVIHECLKRIKGINAFGKPFPLYEIRCYHSITSNS